MSSKFKDELNRIVSEKLSGIMFITSEDNKSAQMYIKEGMLIYAQCQGKKGGFAIDLISKMCNVRFKFQKGPIPNSNIEMPSFDKIISMIGNISTVSNSIHLSLNNEEKNDGSSSCEKVSIEDEKISIVKEVLTDCIGPMAVIIYEENISYAKTISELVDLIAKELPDIQARKFRKDIEGRM